MAEGAAGDIPTPVEDYAYDEEGNRSASHLSAFYSSNAHNQLLEDDSYSYTYDDRGNRVTRTDKATGAVETYNYDSQNRLVGYASDVTTASYAYDALGRRIAKTVNTESDSYVYDVQFFPDITRHNIGLQFSEVDLVRRWVNSDKIDEPIAFEEYSGSGVPASGTAYEIYADHLGSITTVVRGDTQEIVAQYSYDSFGKRSEHVSLLFQIYGYAGREEDSESDLLYLRARHYSPETGRFLQPDPIGFRGGDRNLYSYVWNSPQNWTDPSGLAVLVDFRVTTFGALTIGFGICLVDTDCVDTIQDTGEGVIGAVGSAGTGALVLANKIWDVLTRDEEWRETGDPPPAGHNGPPKDPKEPGPPIPPPPPWWPDMNDPLNDPDSWQASTGEQDMSGPVRADTETPQSTGGAIKILILRVLSWATR